MAIKAVIFDLGETLFNYGEVDTTKMFRAGAHLTYKYLQQIAADKIDLGGFESYYRRHIISIKGHYLWSNITGREFDCLALLDKKARRMGLQPDQGQLEQLAWLWYQPLGENAVLEPQLHQHLQELQEMSLKPAIISNTFLPACVLDRHLESFDLLKFFPVRIYSCETIYRKPDRRIYQAALDKLQVSPAETIMVGDKVREDVKGPGKLGIRGVLKRALTNHTKKIDNDIATINTIAELPELIQRWNHK